MDNVVCEKCYVMNGWIRSCNCQEGPLRTDPNNAFGVRWPSIDGRMGRNEVDASNQHQPQQGEQW